MKKEVNNCLKYVSIKVFISQNICDNSSTHTKAISSTHTGHHTDSGISMSGGMTSTSTERRSVSAIPGSNNEHLNDAILGRKGIPQ